MGSMTRTFSRSEDPVTECSVLEMTWNCLSLRMRRVHTNHGDLPDIPVRPTPLKSTPLDITVVDFKKILDLEASGVVVG